MHCKLCQQKARLIEQFSGKQLTKEYWRQLKIKVTLPDQLGFYKCHSCAYQFFATEDQEDISGDNDFYNTINKIPWYYFDKKHEFDYTKRFISSQDRVLEVGCGKGAFAKYIPQAQYTGLEFSTDAKKMAQSNGITIENISIQDYAKIYPNSADVVCSFQVLEHVSNPHSFIQSKIDACRGGG